MQILVLALRGAAGFGLAAFITFGVYEWVLSTIQRVPQVLVWPVMVVAPMLAGALGAIILGGERIGGKASGAFGCGFVVLWLVVSFSLISLQGGRPDYGWGALAGGVAFALVGASGGAAIDRRLVMPATLFFGIAGAAGGAGAFYLTTAVSVRWGVPIAWTAAGAVAGGLLGAFMGFGGDEEPRSRFRENG